MKSRFKVNEWDQEFQTKSIQESRRVIKETNVEKKTIKKWMKVKIQKLQNLTK